MRIYQVRISGSWGDAIMATCRTRELAEVVAAEQAAIGARHLAAGVAGESRVVEIIESTIALAASAFFCAPTRVDGVEDCGFGWGIVADGAPCPRCGFPALPVRELPPTPLVWPGGDGVVPGTFVELELGKGARS